MLYYKRHIGDYIKDTSHLSLIEHGAYARLMDVYYGREAALPEADVLRLVGARSKEEIAAVALVLKEFWSLTSDGWVQKRCDHEIGKARDKADKNRSNGKKGGRPKRIESEPEPKNNPDGFEQKTQMVSFENPNVTLSNNPTIQLSNNTHYPEGASADAITQWKPKQNPDGFQSGRGRQGNAWTSTENAWRDITECDPQAYESWLAYRAEAGSPVPPRVRIAHAKFLGGKGTPEQQRAFVANLIQLEFKRLRNPDYANGAESNADPLITWRPPPDDEDQSRANG